MTTYLLQGVFPLREGIMNGFHDRPDSMGVLLSWGMWEVPDADNDEEWEDPPEAA